MIKKVIGSNPEEVRAKILKGALIVGDMVGRTLGPKGRNAIIQTAYKAPKVTNDGVTIARHIVLEDPIEDLGAQTIVEACLKTNTRVGDGTTTTAVLACSIIKESANKIQTQDEATKASGISAGADVVGMAREILDAGEEVIKKLKEPKYSRPVKKGDIRNIISTSLGKVYPEYVDALTEMIEKVGKDGYIATEDNWHTKYGVETQIIEGLRFRGSYATPFMVTNKQKEAIWEDAPILVCNHRLEALETIAPLIDKIMARGIRKVVIICEGYSTAFTRTLANTLNVLRQTGDTRLVSYLAVKAPSLTTEQFEDVAAYCGAKFFDKNLGDNKLSSAELAHLGMAKKVVVNEDDTIIIGGKGNVAERVNILKKHIETERDPSFLEQLKRRLGALQSGFGIIRVGASTETERQYIKYKIEDAINAAKAALEEGVVKGGGLVLKEIAQELGEKNILYTPLQAPYEKIKSNAGGELKVPATVIDPVKVTRLAVENACSVAAQLITSEVAIAEKKRTLWDELDQKLYPADNDDFRDPENEEAGYMT